MSRGFWLLLALAATAPFWSLGHPLVEVDDARYSEIPREMVASGQWATPHLNELDYVEKPPLWYWLSASSCKVFGVSEAAARLPMALLAVLGLLGTAWLGAWLYDDKTGKTAALMLGTSGLYFFLSHYITPDLGLTVWLLWCSGLLLRAVLKPEDAAWAAPAAWAFAGLAFLSKGLIGIVFPILWAGALWLILKESRSRFLALLRPAGPLLFLIIAAPWFLLMEHRHPGFLRFFFYEHHVQRFLTQKFNRSNPWYFFLLVLPAGLLPWAASILGGIIRSFSDRRGLALAAWAALVTAFFSTSQSKLISYILPVFPHLCILGAHALQEPAPKWLKRISAILGILLLLAAAAAYPAARFIPADVPHSPWLIALAAAMLASLGTAMLCQSLDFKPLLTGALAGLITGGLFLGGLNNAMSDLSCRELAETVRSRQKPGDLVYGYGIYLHGLPFYTGRRVDKLLNWRGELEYAARDERILQERFGGEEAIRALPLPGKTVFVACRRRDVAYLLSLHSPNAARSVQVFGPWALLEY